MQHFDPKQNFEILMSDNQIHDSRQTSSPACDSPDNSDAQSSGDEYKKVRRRLYFSPILRLCRKRFPNLSYDFILQKIGFVDTRRGWNSAGVRAEVQGGQLVYNCPKEWITKVPHLRRHLILNRTFRIHLKCILNFRIFFHHSGVGRAADCDG